MNIALFLIGFMPFSMRNDSTIAFRIPVRFISHTGKTLLFTTSAHLKDYETGAYHVNNPYVDRIIIEKRPKSVKYYISIIATDSAEQTVYKDHSLYFSKMPYLPRFALKCKGITGSELAILLSKAGIGHIKIPDKNKKINIPAGIYTVKSVSKLWEGLNNNKK